jgi:hypothetical protein
MRKLVVGAVAAASFAFSITACGGSQPSGTAAPAPSASRPLSGAPATVHDTTTKYVANEIGRSTTSPPSGTLYVYDTGMATTKEVRAEYFMHDKYEKIMLAPKGGVVLSTVDIENNCGHEVAARNPTDGTGIECHPVLHTSEIRYPVTGTLEGRLCRTSSCTHPVIVTEHMTGSGSHLTVGGRDHGAAMEIDYTLVTGETDRVILPGNCLITRVVILPKPAHGTEHATVVLN